jgi:DNA polymerase
MLIGDAPGVSETYSGLPYTGTNGEVLDHLLNKLTLSRDDIYITYCIKCKPRKKLPNKKGLMECWKECVGYLHEEISRVKPKIIVPLGNTALELVTGKRFIGKHEGVPCDFEGLRQDDENQMDWDFAPSTIKCYPCYNPGAALKKPSLEPGIGAVLYMAAKEAGLKPKIKGEEAGFYDYEIRS